MARLSPFKFARHSREARGARKGATAVEFALVAPAFLFLIVVGFDLGLAVFIQSALINAAKDSARAIMISPSTATAGTFKTQACSEMGGLIPSCSSNLQYLVKSASSFSALSPTVTVSGGNLSGNGTYSPGAKGQDVVVQLAYNRPTIIPWTMVYLNGTSSTVNTKNLLVATIVLQNEPP